MLDLPEELRIPPGFVENLFNIAGRVAAVTGGASGLGQALAIGYAQAGANVIVLDIDEDGAEATANEITEQGGTAHAMPLDVTDKVAVESVAEKCGHVDILVNGAGSAFRAAAEDFPEDKFEFILDLNLKGTYYCCQAFGRKMLNQGKGSIINIASIGSFVAYPWASAYLASKGGVLQITRAFALEWRDRGVRVNAIGPTLMDTPLIKAVGKQSSITTDFIRERMLRDRLGLPRELIGAAIYLASDASELVTGHTVMCDDGYLIS